MKAVSKSVSTRFALGIFAVAVIASECKSGILAEFGEPDETEHLGAYQYADAVGVGRVVGYGDDYITINVSQYWFGNFATNPVSIYEAFNRWTDGIDRRNPSYFEEKNIVFFATTNHVKQAVPARPKGEFLILESSIGFTNYYGYCAPKFEYSNPPTWYALETNDVQHLQFFSNVVMSVVAAKDTKVLYATLRDAVGVDENGEQPYRGIATRGLMELLRVFVENDLETALVDPLLSMRFRHHALFQLKRRFGWPEESEVPDP